MDLLAYAKELAEIHARKLMQNPGLAERLDAEFQSPLASAESIEAIRWSRAEVLALLHMHAAKLAKAGMGGVSFDLRVIAAWIEREAQEGLK